MQEYINLFVKSIFVDNMVFAFFLGMPIWSKLDKCQPEPDRVTFK